MKGWHPIKILGAVLELPAKQHCQFSPFWLVSQLANRNSLNMSFCVISWVWTISARSCLHVACQLSMASITQLCLYFKRRESNKCWCLKIRVEEIFRINCGLFHEEVATVLLVSYARPTCRHWACALNGESQTWSRQRTWMHFLFILKQASIKR